jgi:hypothetical protein
MPRIEILIDWMCPATKTYILDTDKVGWATIEPFKVTRMPALGSYTVDSVEGEYSFVVMNEKSHAIITHSDTL